MAPFSPAQAETAAAPWERGRPLGLSLADRTCLAPAIERQAPLLTADRAWADLDLRMEIRLVR
jgi:ribonuclease VapC